MQSCKWWICPTSIASLSPRFWHVTSHCWEHPGVRKSSTFSFSSTVLQIYKKQMRFFSGFYLQKSHLQYWPRLRTFKDCCEISIDGRHQLDTEVEKACKNTWVKLTNNQQKYCVERKTWQEEGKEENYSLLAKKVSQPTSNRLAYHSSEG